MKIIVSGGGTGGHIYPALAIAREIKDRVPEADIIYVGTARGLEQEIVPRAGFEFKTIDVTGLDRSSMLKAGKSLAKFPLSFWQARDIIKDFQPDVIVGTGGYVSYPIVLAGTIFGRKTLIHEQNAIPGLANRSLARRVDAVLLTFAEAGKYLEGNKIIVGLPVRKEIMQVDPGKARVNLGLSGDKFTLVAFGGSRGAMSINKAMLEVLERYRQQDIQIIWLTGRDGYEEVKGRLNKYVDIQSLTGRLILSPYMYNMEEALAAADLAVCRAGASTVCELEVLGLPAILVPYPYAADNHQEKNARVLLEKNAAEMVIDEFLDGDTLYKMIEKLRNDKARLAVMRDNILKEARPNALNDIVNIILEMVK